MGYQNSLLFRETLNDTGVIPTAGSIYSSPDIISHVQVADHKNFFKNNYATDPNQRVNMGTTNNFIYTRVKNLQETTEPVTGYLALYKANSSLFMRPSIWRDNPLRTVNNALYSTLTSSTPGEVVVSNDIFLLSGLQNNLFCMVGIVSGEKQLTIPEDFSSYDNFAYWLRMNQSVCVRNLSLEYNCQKYNYERLDSFSNPENQEVLIAFKLIATKLPKDTKFGMFCEPLDIKTESVFESGDKKIITMSAMAPPLLDGYVKTYGILPSGTSTWPAEASLEIESWTEMLPHHQSYHFGQEVAHFNLSANENALFQSNGRLVRIGACKTVFMK